MLQLDPHRLDPTDRATEYGLVDDRPEPDRGRRTVQHLLSADAQRDAALDLLGRDQPATELDDGSHVLRGLQQAGDELQLVGTDQLRGGFEAEVGVEPARQHVAEAVPPAGVVRVPGEGHQALAFLAVVQSVQ